MSLGRTGTMQLIQQNPPPLYQIYTNTCKHTLVVKANSRKTGSASPARAYTATCAGARIDFSSDDVAETNTRTRLLFTSVKYLRRSYAAHAAHAAHAVHFPLCYFIDCGHNYPLFWSTALSEFPLCWTISTEGWLSHAIPQPKGTVYFSCTLIIISKPR